MKFLPLRDFDDVTSALNFEAPDCNVIGGCDLYTTKAAGSDKKLYKNIENSLESQYESLLRLSASVSPPREDSPMDFPTVNLSRSSPFGSLSQISSRRTFAYLIATLNASHPDYDFSHILRPADFHKERSLKAVMNTIDTTLYNLKPSHNLNQALLLPPQTGTSTPNTSQAWGPKMWNLIDKEMTLEECSVYSWAPPDDPFDEDEGSIWSLNYFFFNKDLKRVAYIYVRGVPVLSHSLRQRHVMAKRSASGFDSGANKRARFWLGDKADNITNDQGPEEGSSNMWNDGEDDDDDDETTSDSFHDDDGDEEEAEVVHRSSVRGVSEEPAGRMDIDY